MRMRIDQQADAVYLTLADRAIESSAEVTDGIILDYDADGRVVGIEILDASRRSADATALQTFSLELPTSGVGR